ncbi:hypothetical protein KCU73_g15053, partial [Aureobasidium melanogenum]
MASFTLLARPIFSTFQVLQNVWVRCSSSIPDFIRPPGPIRSWSRDEYNAYNRWKYATNTEYRQKKKKKKKSSRDCFKKRSDTDPEWHRKIIEASLQRKNQRYANDAEYRQAQKLRQRERWANDTDHRQATLQRHKERCANDPDYREADLRRHRERYANNPEFQEATKQRLKERYTNDPEFRETQIQRARERYWRMKFGLPTAQQESQNKSDSQDNSKESDSQDSSKKSDTGP